LAPVVRTTKNQTKFVKREPLVKGSKAVSHSRLDPIKPTQEAITERKEENEKEN